MTNNNQPSFLYPSVEAMIRSKNPDALKWLDWARANNQKRREGKPTIPLSSFNKIMPQDTKKEPQCTHEWKTYRQTVPQDPRSKHYNPSVGYYFIVQACSECHEKHYKDFRKRAI